MEVWPNEALVTVNIRCYQLKYVIATLKVQFKTLQLQDKRAVVGDVTINTSPFVVRQEPAIP